MEDVKRIFEEGEWLSAEEINHFQDTPLQTPASEWERYGRVFSVPYNGKDYYARYQFDSLYQPLPVIKDILEAYGAYEDVWSVAAWFHFPNSWITVEGSDGAIPISPKDALHRCREVINAACNRTGTYLA